MDKTSLARSPSPIVARSSSPGMAGVAILRRRPSPRTEACDPHHDLACHS